MYVYLAGPITGLTFGGATEWREAFVDRLYDMGHIGVSPMRGKDYLREVYKDEVLSKAPITGFDTAEHAKLATLQLSYEQFPMSSAQGIVGRDRFDVAQCEVTLANFLGATAISIGTCMEVQRAADKERFVLLVMEPEGNPNDHPFVRRQASCVVEDLDTALMVLGAFGKPYRK